MSERRPGRSPDDRVTGWGLERVSVRYGRTLALDRVSVGVGAGSVTAVVGADGAGKTTLLRTLVGAQRAASGRIRRPAKRRIGYVSAGPGVYADLTVDENMGFSARAYGVPPRTARERIGQLLAATELSEARRRLAGQLSGGMRQKLALAMAVVHRPELLVLDEPTTGVDPVSRAELWRLMAALAAEGTAIALATTYVDEAERASSVLVLLRGRALAAGTAASIVADVPGELYAIRGPSADPRAWRRGAEWRLWSPGGGAPPEAELREPDLEDALVMAQLAVELRAGPADGRTVAA
jgi:ABC-2 type transport system ATP-binding protein